MSLLGVLTVVLAVLVVFSVASDLRSGTLVGEEYAVDANVDGISVISKDPVNEDRPLKEGSVSESDYTFVVYNIGERVSGKKRFAFMINFIPLNIILIYI